MLTTALRVLPKSPALSLRAAVTPAHVVVLSPSGGVAAVVEEATLVRAPRIIFSSRRILFGLGATALGRFAVAASPSQLIPAHTPRRALTTVSPSGTLCQLRPSVTSIRFCVVPYKALSFIEDMLSTQDALGATVQQLRAMLTATGKKDMDDALIYVLRSVAGATPTPLEEHDVVELPEDVPLGEFLTDPKNGIRPTNAGRVFLLVGPKNIHNRWFTAPPEFAFPVPFEPASLDDVFADAITLAPGKVAGTFDQALQQWVFQHPVRGPLYLDRIAQAGIKLFLDFVPQRESPKVVFLGGPVKASKTTWLFDGIPSLVLAQAAADPTRPAPVFFVFSAPLDSTVSGYFEVLTKQLVEVGAKYGVQLTILSEGNVFEKVGSVVRELCAALSSAQRDLYLLLDEIQLPVISGEFSPSTLPDIQSYGNTFKTIAANGARLVATGSGMATVLSAMRLARPNGFVFLEGSRVARLGQPSTSNDVALRMCYDVVAGCKWLPPQAALEVPLVFDALQQHQVCVGQNATPPRLALVLAVLERMFKGENLSLADAVESVAQKVHNESLSDFERLVSVLQSLRNRAPLSAPGAAGTDARFTDLQILAKLAFNPAEINFHRIKIPGHFKPLVWGDKTTDEPGPDIRLLPPYDAFVQSLMRPDGAMQRGLLSQYYEDCVKQLKFLADVRAHVSEELLQKMNMPILDVMVAHGLIPKNTITTLADAEAATFFHDMIALMTKYKVTAKVPRRVAALQTALADPTTAESQRTLSMLGFAMLAMCRNVLSHFSPDSLDADMSSMLRLSPIILIEMQQSAYKVLYEAGPEHITFLKAMEDGPAKQALLARGCNFFDIIKDDRGIYWQPQRAMIPTTARAGGSDADLE